MARACRQPMQGASNLATPAKQDGVKGITYLSALRQKQYGPMLFVDLYAGSGVNEIGGVEINGTPLSILHGIHDAIRSSKTEVHRMACIFSDIATSRATVLLPERVEAFQRELGLPENRNELVVATRRGQVVRVPIFYRESSATEMARLIHQYATQNPRTRILVGIDPNGPKDAPWPELGRLMNAVGSRVDLYVHLAATAMKRVAGARATGIKFAPMPDHIQHAINFIMSGNGAGWIREPIGADQWTLMLLTKNPPKHGWANQGYYLINSPEGREVIKRMSMTKKELASIQEVAE